MLKKNSNKNNYNERITTVSKSPLATWTSLASVFK